MPACHHRLKSHTRYCTRSTSHQCHQDRYRHSRSRSQPLPTDITVKVTKIHTEDIPSHTIEALDITTRVLHDVLTPVIIIPPVTPHIIDCLHTGIRADHIPIQHTNQVSMLGINLQCIPADLKTICMIKEIQESQ